MINLYEISKFLTQKEYLKALESFLHLANNSLYLALLLNGSLEIVVLSLLFQIIVGLYSSQNEFRKGNILEGFSNLTMAGIRTYQMEPSLHLLKFKWDLQRMLNATHVNPTVGDLGAKWQFPSDHLPVGVKIGNTRLISWNVLNTNYIDWLYKNSQGLKGSMITDLDKPSLKNPQITLREELVIEYILQIITNPANKNLILSLQECRPEFITALTHLLPSNFITLLSDPSLKSNDQEITIFNSNAFECLETIISCAFPLSNSEKTLMDLTFLEKESGLKLQVINVHIPGNPNLPGPDEFARYLLTHTKEECMTIALGDMNFDESRIKQALGSDLFENFVHYNTNVEPSTFKAKDIDLILISSKKRPLACEEMLPNEIIPSLQATVDLLSPQEIALKAFLSLIIKYEYIFKQYLARLAKAI